MTQLCRLTRPEVIKFCLKVKTVRLKKLLCSKICAHTCAANCDQSCLSRALSFWTTCNLYGFRHRLLRRILWTVICSIYNSALPREIDFGLRIKAFLTRFTSSDLLGRSIKCLLSTLPVSPNRSCHQVVLHHTRVCSRRTRIMGSNSAYHNTDCALCCKVDIVVSRRPFTTVGTRTQLVSVKLFELTITPQVPASPYLFLFVS